MKWFFLFLASTLNSQTLVLSTWNQGGVKGVGIQTSGDEGEFFLWSDLKKNAAGGVQSSFFILGVVDWPSLSLARMNPKLPRAWDGAWSKPTQAKLKKTAKEAQDWGVVTRFEEFYSWGFLSEKRRSVGLGGEWRDGHFLQRVGWELALHHLSQTKSQTWFVRSEDENLVAQAQLRLSGGSRQNGWDLLLNVDKEENRLPSPLTILRLALRPQAWLEYWGTGLYQRNLQLQNRLKLQGGRISLTQDLDVQWEGVKGSKELQTQAVLSLWGAEEGVKLWGELLARMGWDEWDFSQSQLSVGLDFKLTNVLFKVAIQENLQDLWEDPLLKASLELGLQELQVTVQVKRVQNAFSGGLKIKLDQPKILGTIHVPWEASKGVSNWEMSLGYRF